MTTQATIQGGRSALRRVTVVVNPAAGGVGPGAAAEAGRIVAGRGLPVDVRVPGEAGIEACLRAALADKPDLLALIAGDGTARTAARLAGSAGVPLAPLPGGTVNRLPRALYGDRPWRVALEAVLTEGRARPVSGGEIDGEAFFVAAVLGAPALWAEAREAAREGDVAGVLARGRRALRRAFAGRLRFSLDGGPRIKAEALALTCPLVSSRLAADADRLEAAAVDPAGALAVFRLGLKVAAGDWRADPAVAVTTVRGGRAWAAGPIPAILDGEPARLGPVVAFRFRPDVFVARVPAADGDEP
ncbi:MAG: diacylglycerol/lipid kinase family protein [Pseudomonadota bacterium]